ncbi:uracil-DNA glycosylase family protein [Falsihalocynthiibacter sp. SS001]|uniref:uracil-DNA glycosylase n=1 Tax=Falsihalocynthiibacter sp. SS001 TaxID=3349698 RepID=UPI0036D3022A
MESELGYYEAKALLEWQIELGADEAIEDAPIDRYEIPVVLAPPAALKPKSKTPPKPVEKSAADLLAEARKRAVEAAQNANTLDELADAMQNFEGCELKKGARGFCFADGNPNAEIMVIGDVPNVDEDRNNTPFYGIQGQLLDRMFAAIGHVRSAPDPETALYLTTVLPWPTPQNRDPSMDELSLMRPFLARHIELVAPRVVVLMGNAPCLSLLGKGNINRQRGKWATAQERPALPMLHPEKLLRSPLSKREAWADLLALQSRLRELKSNG